jgi:hypothetical protein
MRIMAAQFSVGKLDGFNADKIRLNCFACFCALIQGCGKTVINFF